MSNVKYVGMDVHKKITVIVVLNALGYMESHSKVKTTAENIYCSQTLTRGMGVSRMLMSVVYNLHYACNRLHVELANQCVRSLEPRALH